MGTKPRVKPGLAQHGQDTKRFPPAPSLCRSSFAGSQVAGTWLGGFWVTVAPCPQPGPILFVFQPPPPGCPPSSAQLAVMQGANVLVTQRKGNFFLGGSDGGYTIW